MDSLAKDILVKMFEFLSIEEYLCLTVTSKSINTILDRKTRDSLFISRVVENKRDSNILKGLYDGDFQQIENILNEHESMKTLRQTFAISQLRPMEIRFGGITYQGYGFRFHQKDSTWKVLRFVFFCQKEITEIMSNWPGADQMCYAYNNNGFNIIDPMNRLYTGKTYHDTVYINQLIWIY